MKKKFVVFSLMSDTSFLLGLYAEARFDTESEAVTFLEERSKEEKDKFYQARPYLILPEYTV